MFSDSHILSSYHFVIDACVHVQWLPSYCSITGVGEMPSQNIPVQRLPLDLPCSGFVTHSGKSFNKESLTRRSWNDYSQNTTRKWKSCHRLHGIIKKLQTKSRQKQERPLTLRRLMSYIYGAPILDVSRSHTTTQHSR